VSMVDLVIHGNIVTPESILEEGWVAVHGAKIVAIGSAQAPEAASVRDARGRFVMPGAIDGQTHAGSQFGFPGVGQTTRSAIAGGVTTIVDMPYDEPTPVHNRALLDEKVAAIRRHSYSDVALYGTVTAVPVMGDVHRLIEGGVCAFKISSFENHPTRFPRITNEHALDLLEELAPTALPVGLHNEDQEIVKARLARHIARGQTTAEFHSPSRPEVAEMAATATFLELGIASGAHAHIVHISTPRGFELVRQYQANGARATGEMCVHYLHFDAAENSARLGALMKVNPPIRAGVRDALWDEFDRGGIDFVSSDHSAWPLERKTAASIFLAAAGIPGLQTLLPALYTGAAVRRPNPAQFVAKYLSERPAKFFGLWPRKGSLTPGADADIVILDPSPVTYSADKALDGLKWSPFDGETFAVGVAGTYVRGKLVWDGSKIVGSAGDGEFIARLH
jgi:allantoinase